jgi:uncharacterized protein GlcG (DUF336 family)
VNLSIDIARRILEASKQRAKELRSPVSIAIVDSGGHLVLFERMMAPYGWATGDISIAKANTAVMFNQSTDAVAQWGAAIPGFASSLSSMTDGKFIMAAGGWPIRIGGATIGGIGVSGGNAPGRDDEIARAGLGAAEGMGQPIPAQRPPQPQPMPMPSQSSQPSPGQEHSRPYMQPVPSYPPMPAVSNSGVNNSGFQPIMPPAPAVTRHISSDQLQEDNPNPYSDDFSNQPGSQADNQSDDNRSGGQS